MTSEHEKFSRSLHVILKALLILLRRLTPVLFATKHALFRSLSNNISPFVSRFLPPPTLMLLHLSFSPFTLRIFTFVFSYSFLCYFPFSSSSLLLFFFFVIFSSATISHYYRYHYNNNYNNNL